MPSPATAMMATSAPYDGAIPASAMEPASSASPPASTRRGPKRSTKKPETSWLIAEAPAEAVITAPSPA